MLIYTHPSLQIVACFLNNFSTNLTQHLWYHTFPIYQVIYCDQCYQKLFLRSIKNSHCILFLSIQLVFFSINLISIKEVDLSVLNPYWLSVSSLWFSMNLSKSFSKEFFHYLGELEKWQNGPIICKMLSIPSFM